MSGWGKLLGMGAHLKASKNNGQNRSSESRVSYMEGTMA